MQLWLREHNRICDAIQQHPNLSKRTGNRQFQIAKAVVVAKMQQITVNGFLPALGITQPDLEASQEGVAGSRFFQRFGAKGRGKRNPRKNVSLEFSMAYRLGHTMIPDVMGDINIVDLFDGQVRLHDRYPACSATCWVQ